MNIDDIIAMSQPRTEEVRICMRGDLVARHAQAVEATRAAAADDDSLAGGAASVAAAQAVVDIEDEMEKGTAAFILRAVSRQRWANLIAEHPPSAEERRAGNDTNPVTFPPAAVAVCSQDPVLTVEQAQRLSEVIPMGDWNRLWLTVVGLNTMPTPSPKLAAATELLQANGHSSTTSPPAGSLEDGSLAGSGEQ